LLYCALLYCTLLFFALLYFVSLSFPFLYFTSVKYPLRGKIYTESFSLPQPFCKLFGVLEVHKCL
jgi:hypothetical protein